MAEPSTLVEENNQPDNANQYREDDEPGYYRSGNAVQWIFHLLLLSAVPLRAPYDHILGRWIAPTMKNSMGKESIVLLRDASKALLAHLG